MRGMKRSSLGPGETLSRRSLSAPSLPAALPRASSAASAAGPVADASHLLVRLPAPQPSTRHPGSGTEVPSAARRGVPVGNAIGLRAAQRRHRGHAAGLRRSRRRGGGAANQARPAWGFPAPRPPPRGALARAGAVAAVQLQRGCRRADGPEGPARGRIPAPWAAAGAAAPPVASAGTGRVGGGPRGSVPAPRRGQRAPPAGPAASVRLARAGRRRPGPPLAWGGRGGRGGGGPRGARGRARGAGGGRAPGAGERSAGRHAR
ncbi:hypothetical protein SALBM311S_03531 [Streptomyces alboniger]